MILLINKNIIKYIKCFQNFTQILIDCTQFNLVNRSIEFFFKTKLLIEINFNLIVIISSIPYFNERSASKQRVKTEVVQPNIDFHSFSQKANQSTAYFPRLKEQTTSPKKKIIQKKAKCSSSEDSPIATRDLQKSLEYTNETTKKRNLTPLQQRTLDVQKSYSKSEHLNQEQIMQFSFGLQYNRQCLDKSKHKFPKDIFVGDVRKVKRIFQQQ